MEVEISNKESSLYLWSLVNAWQQWASQDFRSGFLYTALDKLLVDRFLHKHPGSSQTALALVKEQTTVGLLHCVLYCKTDMHTHIYKSKVLQLHLPSSAGQRLMQSLK